MTEVPEGGDSQKSHSPRTRHLSTANDGLYNQLGLAKTATEDDIKRAYRKMALKYHPDKNPDNPEATEKFKDINFANSILSNPTKRRIYDSYGEMGLNAAETLGDDNMAAYLLSHNPFAKFFFVCCGIFTGCFCGCCCCCLCCCNFCCGKFAPIHVRQEDFEFPPDELPEENGKVDADVVITSQPESTPLRNDTEKVYGGVSDKPAETFAEPPKVIPMGPPS